MYNENHNPEASYQFGGLVLGRDRGPGAICGLVAEPL
jgi:hypothetical protein